MTQRLPIGFAALLMALLFGAALPCNSSAQETLYQQANAAFGRGDFLTAAHLLEQAYLEEPEAAYLVNRGTAYQKAGEWVQAKAAFDAVLVRHRDDPAACAAARKGLTEITPLLPPPPGPPRPVPPWLLSGAGVLVAGTGGTLLALAYDKRETVRNADTDVNGAVTGISHEEATELRDQANDYALAGTILVGAGAAALAGGIVWTVLSWDSLAAPESSFSAAPLADGASITWSTTF